MASWEIRTIKAFGVVMGTVRVALPYTHFWSQFLNVLQKEPDGLAFTEIHGPYPVEIFHNPRELAVLTLEELRSVAGRAGNSAATTTPDKSQVYVGLYSTLPFVKDQQVAFRTTMAIWGAPVWDQDHAVHAVQAALGAAARISQEREAAEARGDTGFDVKIGLNSGQAVVGRLGAAQRGTYTAAGETVNLAARLESVPALYHCQVVIGPRTAELIACRFLLRELDTIKVKGIERPIPVFEPLAELPVSGEQGERVRRYADAVALYRAARFAEAAALWEDLARGGASHPQADHRGPTGPPAMMAKRARQLAGAPPQAWEGVWVLTGK